MKSPALLSLCALLSTGLPSQSLAASRPPTPHPAGPCGLRPRLLFHPSTHPPRAPGDYLAPVPAPATPVKTSPLHVQFPSRTPAQWREEHKEHCANVPEPLSLAEYKSTMERLERLLASDPDGKRPDLGAKIRELSERLGV